MELRQLACFVAVAEELSFTRAARRLHLVQSGVSASVRALERALDAALFERTTQRVALTGAGAALLPEARAALAAAQRAADAVARARGTVAGTLTIGTVQSAAPLDLPAVLARFHAEHPGVTVRLRHGGAGSAVLAEELQAGQLDVAFVSLERAPAGVELVPLSVEEIVLVCRPEHPLARPRGSRGAAQRTARARSTASPAARPAAPRRVPLARAARETLIDFPPGYGNRMAADRAFAAAGVERTIAYEVAEFGAALQLVRHGLGVAFLPAFVVAGLDDVAAVRLREPLRMRMSAAVSTTPPAAARAFLATVERVARARVAPARSAPA